MAAFIGFYLHGFLSSGNSEKGQWFKRKVEENPHSETINYFSDWLTPTYPIGSVKQTVLMIEELLLNSNQQQPEKPIVLLGSSMGGFYAQYFGQKYRLPYIMINPALNPEQVFSENMGEHLNPATGEKVVIDQGYIDQLLEYKVEIPDYRIPALLLIDTDDEVIDVDYALDHYTAEKLINPCSKRLVFSGGDHRFIHLEEAWQAINSFINTLPESKAEK